MTPPQGGDRFLAGHLPHDGEILLPILLVPGNLLGPLLSTHATLVPWHCLHDLVDDLALEPHVHNLQQIRRVTRLGVLLIGVSHSTQLGHRTNLHAGIDTLATPRFLQPIENVALCPRPQVMGHLVLLPRPLGSNQLLLQQQVARLQLQLPLDGCRTRTAPLPVQFVQLVGRLVCPTLLATVRHRPAEQLHQSAGRETTGHPRRPDELVNRLGQCVRRLRLTLARPLGTPLVIHVLLERLGKTGCGSNPVQGHTAQDRTPDPAEPRRHLFFVFQNRPGHHVDGITEDQPVAHGLAENLDGMVAVTHALDLLHFLVVTPHRGQGILNASPHAIHHR